MTRWAVVPLLIVPAIALAMPQERQGRQRAPESFACDRNDLTVYTGVVIGYQRRIGTTTLRIRTDSDTTERVSLSHPGTDDPSTQFRMLGEPFTSGDWSKIEERTGVLKKGTRAAAWVCTKGRVMVDWGRPGRYEGIAPWPEPGRFGYLTISDTPTTSSWRASSVPR